MNRCATNKTLAAPLGPEDCSGHLKTCGDPYLAI
jgi:hypothetical protein